MTKFSLIAAGLFTALVPAVALAADAGATKFNHKGVDYQYTKVEAAGDTVVKGTAYAGTVPFELHIHKKSVTGTFNNAPVEFTLDEVKAMGITTTN